MASTSSALLLRGLVTIFVNLAVGFVILGRQQLDDLWGPFGIVAVGLLVMAMMAMSKKLAVAKASFLSFVVSVLVPLFGMGTALVTQNTGSTSMDLSTLEGLLAFGTVAVIFGWKECLLMFALNFGLLYWYSRAQ